MKKLKLNLDEIKVESFETVKAKGTNGTVYGEEYSGLPYTGCCTVATEYCSECTTPTDGGTCVTCALCPTPDTNCFDTTCFTDHTCETIQILCT